VPRPFTTVARFLYYYYYCQPPRPRFPDLDHLLMGVVLLHFLAAFHAFMKEACFFWTKSFFFQKLKTGFHACPAMLCAFFKFVS
jgi:hypothetical protein